jgi:hypothetical protein
MFGKPGSVVVALLSTTATSPSPSSFTPTPEPTPTYDPRLPDPTQAVTAYYYFLNQGQYDLAWRMLSDNYKERRSSEQGRAFTSADYAALMSQITRVTIDRLQLQGQRMIFGEWAEVSADITYYLRSGETGTREQEFWLKWNQATRQWQVDELTSTSK